MSDWLVTSVRRRDFSSADRSDDRAARLIDGEQVGNVVQFGNVTTKRHSSLGSGVVDDFGGRLARS
jgi:hypothetical protein